MIMLADIPESLPQGINQWLLAATVVMILSDYGLRFWKDHMREQPSPRDTYATKQELAAMEQACKDRKMENAQRLDRHGNYMATKSDLDAVRSENTALARDLEEWKQEIRANGELRKQDIEKKVETSFGQCQQRIAKVETDVATGFKHVSDTLHDMTLAIGRIEGRQEERS